VNLVPDGSMSMKGLASLFLREPKS
jgi:hypothetical protein